MKKKIIKRILIFSLALFALTLFLPFLFFNNYNIKKIQVASIALSSSFEKYLMHNKTILNMISSDRIIKSSILQYYAGENIKTIQKRINGTKEQYDNVKFISIYDKTGRQILATDYFKQNAFLNIHTLLNRSPLFHIQYFLEFNQYLCIATIPLKNELNMKIGYITAAFTLAPLWESIHLTKDYAVFLYQDSQFLLAYPSNMPIFDISSAQPKKNYTLIKVNGKTYYQVFLSSFQDKFTLKLLYKLHNQLFWFIAVINGLLLAGIIILIILYWLQSKIAEHDEVVKKTTDELLKFSQQTLKNVSITKDALEDLNYKREELSQNLNKIKSFSAGKKNIYDEFKVIEPE